MISDALVGGFPSGIQSTLASEVIVAIGYTALPPRFGFLLMRIKGSRD